LSLPLTGPFVGDAVVNLIPLGLIYSVLFDDVCVTIVSCDCCSSWTIVDDSSNDGIIIGNIVWGDVSLSLFVVTVLVGGIVFVALSIAVGRALSSVSDD